MNKTKNHGSCSHGNHRLTMVHNIFFVVIKTIHYIKQRGNDDWLINNYGFH